MAAALGNHMMKKTILVRWSMGIMLAACVSVTPARAQKLESADFRRGIGIAHVMAWASIDPGASRAFTFPPFSIRPMLSSVSSARCIEPGSTSVGTEGDFCSAPRSFRRGK